MSRAPVFPVEEKVRVVLSILAGEVSVAGAFARQLAARRPAYRLHPPLFAPVVGAALYAARLARAPLSVGALDRLRSGWPG